MSESLLSPYDIHYLVIDNKLKDTDPQNFYSSFSFSPLFIRKLLCHRTYDISEIIPLKQSYLDDSVTPLFQEGAPLSSSLIDDFKRKYLFSFLESLNYLKNTFASYEFLTNWSIAAIEANVKKARDVEGNLRSLLLNNVQASDNVAYSFKDDFDNLDFVDEPNTTSYYKSGGYFSSENSSDSELEASEISVRNSSRQFFSETYDYSEKTLLSFKTFSQSLSSKTLSLDIAIISNKVKDSKSLILYLKTFTGISKISLIGRNEKSESFTISKDLKDLRSRYKILFSIPEGSSSISLSFEFSDFSGIENGFPFFALFVKKIHLSSRSLNESNDTFVVTKTLKFPISDSLNYSFSAFKVSAETEFKEDIQLQYRFPNSTVFSNHLYFNGELDSPIQIANRLSELKTFKTVPANFLPNEKFAVSSISFSDYSLEPSSNYSNLIETKDSFVLRNVFDFSKKNDIWIRSGNFYSAYIYPKDKDVTLDFGPNVILINSREVFGTFLFKANKLYYVQIPNKFFINMLSETNLSQIEKKDPLHPYNPKALIEGLDIPKYPLNNFIISSFCLRYVPYQLFIYLEDEDLIRSSFSFYRESTFFNTLYLLLPLESDFNNFYKETNSLLLFSRKQNSKESEIVLRFSLPYLKSRAVNLSGYTIQVV